MLTDEQQETLFNKVLNGCGCPVLGVTDRLSAFVAGVRLAIRAVAPQVSLDKENGDA